MISAATIPIGTRGSTYGLHLDVEIDSRGLIYIVDRYPGFDVLEFSR
ncbi:MAG TPA: hypothetical protein VIW78_02365 [Burkholderiales bacterium]